jgi:hypothetical protein
MAILDCEGYLLLIWMIVFVVELWYVAIVSSVLSMVPEMRMKCFHGKLGSSFAGYLEK